MNATTPGAPSEREAIAKTLFFAAAADVQGKGDASPLGFLTREGIDILADAILALRPPAPESGPLDPTLGYAHGHEDARAGKPVRGSSPEYDDGYSAGKVAPESGEVTQGDDAIARQMLADQYVLEGGGAEIAEAIRQDDQVLIRDDTAIRAMVAYAHRLASLDALRPAGEVEGIGWLIEEGSGGAVHWIALSSENWPRLEVRNRQIRDYDVEEYRTPIRRTKDASDALRFARREDAEAFMALFDRFLVQAKVSEHMWPTPSPSPTPTPPPEEVAGLVERLRGLLDECEASERDRKSHDYRSEHRSRIAVAELRKKAAEAVPALLDAIAALSAQVAGSGWRPIETVQMWEVAVVTDGENVAIAQLAESDIGDPYWSIDPEDALEWEPTLWMPVPSIAGGEDGRG